MKRIILVVGLLGMIFMVGCGADGIDGKDGADGEAYIAYSWVSGPFTYSTNDHGIPSYIYSGTYYKTIPGTYSFWYRSWDSSEWSGSYTIYINKGQPGTPGGKGGLFKKGEDGIDGADGADIYFELTCYSIGATLYKWSFPYYSSLNLNTDYQNKLAMEIKKIGYKPVETGKGYRKDLGN